MNNTTNHNTFTKEDGDNDDNATMKSSNLFTHNDDDENDNGAMEHVVDSINTSSYQPVHDNKEQENSFSDTHRSDNITDEKKEVQLPSTSTNKVLEGDEQLEQQKQLKENQHTNNNNNTNSPQKITRIPPPSSSNQKNIEKIIRFLKHPSIVHLSQPIKESYLLSHKDVSKDMIQLAMNRMKKDDDTGNDNDIDNGNKRMKQQKDYNQKLNRIWNNENHDDSNYLRSTTPSSALDNIMDYQTQKSSNQNNENRDFNGKATAATPTRSDGNHIHSNSEHEQYPQQQYHHQQQQQQSPPYQQSYFNHNNNNNPHHPHPHSQPPLPELPNPIVPMTIGGMLTIFGLATYRWINGDDFVLFPNHTNYNTNSNNTSNVSFRQEQDDENYDIQVHNNNHNDNDTAGSIPDIQSQSLHTILESNNIDNKDFDVDNGIIPDFEDEDDNNNEENEEEEEATEIYQEIINHHRNDTNIISNDIKNLTLVIEKYVALQERSMKEKSDEKARSKTNSAMDLLRNHQSSSSNDSSSNNNTGGDKGSSNNTTEMNANQRQGNDDDIISIATLIQITEFKCSILELTNQLTRIHSLKDDDGSGEAEKGTITIHKETNHHQDLVEKLDKISIYLNTLQKKLSNKNNEEILANDMEVKTSGSSSSNDGSNTSTIQSNKIIPLSKSETSDCVEDKENTEDDVNKEEEQKEVTSDPVIEQTNDKDQHESKQNESVEENTKVIAVNKESLLESLKNFQKSNEPSVVKSCAQMLFLYTSKLSSNPKSNQYQKIYTNSKTFLDKVGTVQFAKEVLLSIGFVDEGKSFLEWKNFSSVEDAVVLVKDASTMLNLLKKGESIT